MDSTYQVPKGEEGSYHVEIQRVGRHFETGEPLYKPFVQKFNPRDFDNFKKHHRSHGVTYKILHQPA